MEMFLIINWIIALAVLILVGFILDREVYFYEGTHLGPRVQAWLYDRWSKKYDTGKRESQLRDNEMLARPLLELLKDIPEPFILDFATGTGRLSHALLGQEDFKGRIIALDLSQGMLEQAAAKLGLDPSSGQSRAIEAPKNIELLRHQTFPLPFPDSAFDVVCALEVLELFPNMDKPLAEFSRVLRPGGVFLTSRGTEESGRRAKVKNKTVLSSLLKNSGFEDLQIVSWWKLFDRVFAKKTGRSEPVEARTLSAVLRCRNCSQIQWRREAGVLKCLQCGQELPITKGSIVLN